MAENELHTSAQRFLDALSALESSADWNRIEKEGDPNHTDPNQPTARSLLETARWLAEQVVNARGLALFYHSGQSRQYLDDLSSIVPRIADFSLTQHEKSEFQEVTAQIHQWVLELLRDLGPWATAHAAQRVDRPVGQIAEAQRESGKLLTAIRNDAESVRRAADEARNEAIKAGAAVFAEEFGKEADNSTTRSRRWLAAGIFTLLLAGGVAVWIMSTTPSDVPRGWLWLQPLAGKVFLLSLLTYATTWCGRMSLANHHSASVNRHRANSITTVKAFRESGTADATKDAIVLEAARAVFENVQTGYLGKSAEQQPATKTVEILRPLGE